MIATLLTSHLLNEINRLRIRCRELEDTIKTLKQANPEQVSSPMPATTSTGLAERLIIRLLSREGSAAATLKSNIGRQLGTADENDEVAPVQSGPLWPPRSIAVSMINAYYERNSNKFYPVLTRRTIMQE